MRMFGRYRVRGAPPQRKISLMPPPSGLAQVPLKKPLVKTYFGQTQGTGNFRTK